MKVMLDGGGAPQAQLIGSFHDVAPTAQGLLEQFGVPPDGPHRHPFGLGRGRHDRVHLDDNFDQRACLERLGAGFLFMAEGFVDVT